jgi:hypothetical protein
MSMDYLIPRRKKSDLRAYLSQGARYGLGKFKNGVWLISTNVKYLVVGRGTLDTAGYDGGHIADVAECPGLPTVAEYE